jgi:hypothetical protein
VPVFERLGPAVEMPDRGRPFDIRSCPYVGRNPAEYSVTGFIKGKIWMRIAQERLSALRQAAKPRLRHCGHLQVRNCGANGF